MGDESFVALIAKISVPIGMATTIVGGSAWLTNTHNMTLQNTREIREYQIDFKVLDLSTDKNRERIVRIEERLDFLVKMMDKKI